MTTADRALILDVDGVVSPVKGTTAWGDDVEAGWAFGPVPVSPTLVARLDDLATTPGLTCWWLTSWSPAMRAHMDPFPGADWPDIPNLHGDPHAPESEEWWKWAALDAWLRDHSGIRRLAWCDDHLATPMFELHDTGDLTDAAPACRRVYQQRLAERGVDALLLAPPTNTGLTPAHMRAIEAGLTP